VTLAITLTTLDSILGSSGFYLTDSRIEGYILTHILPIQSCSLDSEFAFTFLVDIQDDISVNSGFCSFLIAMSFQKTQLHISEKST
jgi:hypothetical protein